jgi:hypothetical protein
VAKIIDTVKSFLRGPTPAAQLVEIEAAIRPAETELAQHRSRRPAEVLAKMAGDPDAAARVDAIDAAIATLEARVRDLRDAEGEVRRRIATEQAAARRREAEARPKTIARLRRERMRRIQQFTDSMESAAAAMQAVAGNSAELAEALDSEPARRFLSFHAFCVRARSATARAFAIDPTRSLSPDNSLLGIASYEHGERSHWTAAQHEEPGLDDLAPFFDDRSEAEAARDRLVARKAPVIVVPLAGDVWTLVTPENAYADQEAAEKAARAALARGLSMAILGHESGFVLVPDRFAGGIS